MKTTDFLFGIGFSLVFVSLGFLLFSPSFSHEIGSIEVPCYDNSNNPIKGVVCIEEEYAPNYEYFWVVLNSGISVGFILIAIGLSVGWPEAKK